MDENLEVRDDETEMIEIAELVVAPQPQEGEILDVPSQLTESEARQLTDGIKSTTNALCLMLKRAHDGKAWKAMGYESWTEYIEREFDFSRVRSYQLIAQAKVIEEISEATGAEVYLTEKEAKEIKAELPKITKAIKEAVDDLEDEEEKVDVAKEIVEEAMDNSEGGGSGSFNLNTVKKVLSIIEGLPDPGEVVRGVTTSESDRDQLLTRTEEAIAWLEDFASELGVN